MAEESTIVMATSELTGQLTFSGTLVATGNIEVLANGHSVTVIGAKSVTVINELDTQPTPISAPDEVPVLNNAPDIETVTLTATPTEMTAAPVEVIDRSANDHIALGAEPAPDIAMMSAMSEEEVLRLLNENGMSLFYVRIKTDLYVKTAIQQNGMAIQYVPNSLMTAENKRLAIKQNPDSLRWIKEQTESLCDYAIYLKPMALRWCLMQTPMLVETALKGDPKAIQWVWERDMVPAWYLSKYPKSVKARFPWG